jgi:F0F1-type ATP synthase assembly protein I
MTDPYIDASNRFKEYISYLRSRADEVPHLKDKAKIKQLRYELHENATGCAICMGVLAFIAILIGLIGHKSSNGGSWIILIVWLLTCLILGLAVIWRNQEYVKNVNNKFDELNIQDVWDNYPDAITNNKIMTNDAPYETVDDIKV